MRSRHTRSEIRRALRDVEQLWRPPDVVAAAKVGAPKQPRDFNSRAKPKSTKSPQHEQDQHREWVDEYDAEERRLEREGFLR